MKNTIIFFDFEASGLSPKIAQPCQLAAVAIDPFKLEIQSDGVFNSYIRPEFDEKKCKKLNLKAPDEEFYNITQIEEKTLEDAPQLKTVWQQFTEFVEKFNYKSSKWSAPIAAGQNIINYDLPIVNRICGGHFYEEKIEHDKYETFRKKKIWGYGPWDKERDEQTLFHPRDKIDTLSWLNYWFVHDESVRSLSMDSMRAKMGIKSKRESHNALVDVVQGAYLVIKFLKLSRHFYSKVKFGNSFAKVNAEIDQVIDRYWK